MSCKYVFDMKDEDVYWCSADVGWITGHSYNVYGPLSNGAQILIYEGAPNYPDPSRLFCQLGLSALMRHPSSSVLMAKTTVSR